MTQGVTPTTQKQIQKKTIALSTRADEAAQQAFIDDYETLMNSLGEDETVLFSDTLHPEYQSRPSHGWFPNAQF